MSKKDKIKEVGTALDKIVEEFGVGVIGLVIGNDGDTSLIARFAGTSAQLLHCADYIHQGIRKLVQDNDPEAVQQHVPADHTARFCTLTNGAEIDARDKETVH